MGQTSVVDEEDLDFGNSGVGGVSTNPPNHLLDTDADTSELATRLTLARRRKIGDATEMDLVQFLLSRGGEA